MKISRRTFLRTALLAPLAAAAAPLAGKAATHQYMRFKAASLDMAIVGQILWAGNLVWVAPHYSRVLVGITA